LNNILAGLVSGIRIKGVARWDDGFL